MKSLISFDWAMKKLLRDKANFAVLEGFLTELFKFEVTIIQIGESESNQQQEVAKNMLSKGFAVKEITTVTGLAEKEIPKLK